MKRSIALVALAFTLAFAGCSKTNETSTTSTTAAESTTTKASSDDTKKSTTTTEEETTTTKKKTGTTTGKKDPKIEKIISGQKQAAESAGVDFTDQETECMAGWLGDHPEATSIDNPTTKEEWDLVFNMISSCIDKEKFIDMSLGSAKGLTTSQKACLKAKMMDLSVDDFAGMAADDPATTKKLEPIFSECQSA